MNPDDSTQQEHQWKASTQSANHHFAEQRYESAQKGYEQALAIAETQLQEASLSASSPLRPVVPMFVIACHNLADCYRCLNEPAKHLACLQRAHHRLLALCQDQNCPQSLRQQCLCDLSKTLFPLVECLRGQKPDQVAELVAQTQAVAATLQTANMT